MPLPICWTMFCIDEATAEAIRRVYTEDGELSAVAELRRHFPLINDHADGLRCVRMIAGWQPLVPPVEVTGQVIQFPERRRLP